MSIVNTLIGVLALAIVIAIGYRAGELVVDLNTPQTPQVSRPANFTLPEIDEGNATATRWTGFPLTVYINAESLDGSDASYLQDFRRAMKNWEDATGGLVKLTEVNDKNADITVEWVTILKENSLDNIGDTELEFVNTSYGSIIRHAHIELLLRSEGNALNDNDMTNLALHELGHALGLRHTQDSSSIMYPVLTVPSSKAIEVSEREASILDDVYSMEAKPDLRIVQVNATKSTVKRLVQTYYLLNISIIIENDGLLTSQPPILQIKAGDKIVKTEEALSIDPGAKLSIIYGNLYAEEDFTTLQIILDPENSIDEMDERNNVADLSIVEE